MEADLVKAKIFKFMNLGIACLASCVFLVFISLDLDYKFIAWGAGFYAAGSLVLHFAGRLCPSLACKAHILIALWLGVTSYMTYNSGGISGPIPGIFAPIPLISLIFLKPKETYIWTGLIIATSIFLSFFPQNQDSSEKWAYLIFQFAIIISILIIGMIHYSLTETNRKKREDAQAQLVQSGRLASLGEMSAGVAHEINNPLCIISMKAGQLISLDKVNKLEKDLLSKHLNDIVNGCDRITGIVKGLRTFARDSSDDEFSSTSVKLLIDEVLLLATERLKHASIDLKVSDFSDDLVVDCKKVQLGQVLINLINNSHDAIKELDERWVRINVKDLEHKIQIKLTDSGKGIPKEVVEKVMLPFFTTKPIGSGTGLGLSISAGIIKSHQGRLFADEDDPHTSFVIELPKSQEKANA